MNLTGFINNNIQGIPNYGAIGTAIDNNINNKPNYSEISGAINDSVNTDRPGANWGSLAMRTLGGMKPTQTAQEEIPKINFRPTMMQPQYVDTNFQNQQSNIANTKLYDYLTR